MVEIAGKRLRGVLTDLGLFGVMWLIAFFGIFPITLTGAIWAAIAAAIIVLVTLLVQFVYLKIRKNAP